MYKNYSLQKMYLLINYHDNSCVKLDYANTAIQNNRITKKNSLYVEARLI